MPLPSKVELTVSYSFEGKERSISMKIDPCELEIEREVVEVLPKNGCRCWRTTDSVVVNLKGIHHAIA